MMHSGQRSPVQSGAVMERSEIPSMSADLQRPPQEAAVEGLDANLGIEGKAK